MKAKAGDRLVILAKHLDEPTAEGEILDVRGPDGDPPYLVRWDNDGHEGLVFPGPDAHVVPSEHSAHA